jgi:hypothetical protein
MSTATFLTYSIKDCSPQLGRRIDSWISRNGTSNKNRPHEQESSCTSLWKNQCRVQRWLTPLLPWCLSYISMNFPTWSRTDPTIPLVNWGDSDVMPYESPKYTLLNPGTSKTNCQCTVPLCRGKNTNLYLDGSRTFSFWYNALHHRRETLP